MSLHEAWTALRHGGNLLAPTALEGLPAPGNPPWGLADRLRSALVALDPDKPAAAALGDLLDTVLEEACGLHDGWQKGNALGAADAEKLLDGTVLKPRRRWTGPDGEVLAVFTTSATRIGVGKGRRPAAQAVGLGLLLHQGAASRAMSPNEKKTMKNVSSPQQPLPSPLPLSKVGEVLPRYLTWREVISWSRLSRATLRREIAAARFPAPDTLSPGREAFRVDKLREWQEGGERAVLMRQGFESIAAGEAPADVLRRLTALGLLSKKGRPVRYQEFRKLLRNPFYKGVTRSGEWGIETKGQHEPLVDVITWSRVQQRLDGRYGKTVQPPRRKENPEFPLRGFVRCAACGRPMTASNSRGKLGKTYPYYRCWRKGCGAAQVRAERLEQSFSDLLRGAEVSSGTMRLVKGTLLDIWKELHAESGQQTATAKRRITELERRKQRLVQAYVYDQAIDRPTYDKELAELDESLTLANLELQDAQMEDLDLEAALEAASALLTSTSRIWETASAPKKRRLQPLLFPEGITFDGKAIGTPTTAFVFSALGQKEAGMVDLVEPKGVEPSTS